MARHFPGRCWGFWFAVLTVAQAPAAESRSVELALVLSQPPVATRFGHDARGFAAASYRETLRAEQFVLRGRLAKMGIHVEAASDTFVNAIYVTAEPERIADLSALPGVATVAITRRMHRTLDRALDLQNVKQAWTQIDGGQTKAGAGIKIAILDSGIDQTHPGLADASLKPPAGFPVGDTAWTSNKVIAARSYVPLLSSSDPAISSPDDNSPRDHVGHGTGLAMIAAGNSVQAPAALISGVAPKAFLGNYKIFGSPGVNELTNTAALVKALEDAYNDGMDVALLSFGVPALYGPLDTTASCGQTQLVSYIPATACDVNAYAVEHAAQNMLVVVAAGNDGCAGLNCPTLGTINSPGTAPSALTVGSTANSHVVVNKVSAGGQTWSGVSGTGPRLDAPLTAGVVDVSTISGSALACAALPAGSLAGMIALVQSGTCSPYLKVDVASSAGAIAVILYDPQSNALYQPAFGLNETAIPLEYVGSTAGGTIKSLRAADPNVTVKIDPAFAFDEATADTVAFDSSRGPSLGLTGLKPEIAAVGSQIYTATQNYDKNGDTYDASRYTGVDGTSYAAAMVAGAAALVKQNHAGYSPAQIKSALVNTASQSVVDVYDGKPARVNAVGAGKLDANAGLQSNITVAPQVLSLGLLGGRLASPAQVAVTNTGSSSVSLSLSIARRDADGNATLTVSPQTLTLNPGQTQNVTVTMSGRNPTFGNYEGQINITGGSVPLHIPYLYIVGANSVGNSYPVAGDNYFATTNEYPDLIAMRITDPFGAPVVNAPVQWTAVEGGAVDFRNASQATNAYGIAGAYLAQSPIPGFYEFYGITVGNYGWDFYQYVNIIPTISKGIFNAATQQGGSLAPGSYVSLSGIAFSTLPIVPNSANLPLSLGEVSVSFDAGGISVPAPISYMSPNFINVQVPWEMAGQSSASVKVTYHGIPGVPATINFAPTSPAYFEYTDSTNSQLSVVAQDANFALITSQHGAVRGNAIVLYANGLGPVTNTPATGAPSSATNISKTTSTPEVTIGGKSASVLFSGMTPFTVGLYQINVMVPPDASQGLQPLTIAIGGVMGKSSQVFIQ
jgi:uncharacterized protein (TIGR03437 family)